ncbi:hypothetical protein LPJ66_003353 [Kickxella alabastrina]|uniref:Uncharacterized protein n=1 Tax=Kickxella alabastrina TaxID=61397 RepID=A0ACC1IMD3_9FUNG|nr:hypothetical protein LPJ66_003353 [Kickxella alabastrina]
MAHEALLEALNGPSDCSFIHWLLNESESLLVELECALQDNATSDTAANTNLLTKEQALEVYEKLSQSLQDSEAQALARGLQDEYILVGATLFDLAATFGASHQERAQDLLVDLYERAPWLEIEAVASSELFIDQLVQFQNAYSQTAELVLAAADAETAGIDEQFLVALCSDLEWQLAMAASWSSLVEACQPLAAVFLQDSRCFLSLAKSCDLTTRLISGLRRPALGVSSSDVDRCSGVAKALKWHWVGLAHCSLRALLGLDSESSINSAAILDQPDGGSVLMEVLDSLETTESQLVPFSNAPFLFDLEFRFGLQNMLSQTLLSSKTLLDDAQIDYIVMSVDQLKDMADPLYRDGMEVLKSRVLYARLAAESATPAFGTDADTDSTVAAAAESETFGDDDAAAIAQISELIPDLGAGFVRACLDHYEHDPEAVVNAIFEGILPPLLDEMDRTTEDWPSASDSVHVECTEELLSQADDVLGNRRNIFDNDEFDIFRHDTLDWSRVNIGKAKLPTFAGTPSSDIKSRVMQIAQRIEDEDEYDDTYDDTAQDSILDMPDTDEFLAARGANNQRASHGPPAKEGPSASKQPAATDPTRRWEEVLVRQFISDPSVLERKKGVRKLPARHALRTQTELSDEQLEGWLTMFQRSPRKQQTLANFGFSGEQPAIPNARANDGGGGGDTLESNHVEGAGEGQKPAGTNYRYKDKNKAKIGNHNRKQQQARKVRNTLGP